MITFAGHLGSLRYRLRILEAYDADYALECASLVKVGLDFVDYAGLTMIVSGISLAHLHAGCSIGIEILFRQIALQIGYAQGTSAMDTTTWRFFMPPALSIACSVKIGTFG